MFSLFYLITAGWLGVLIGCVFFYCLWFSSKKIMGSSHPITWFIGAWLGRMLFALTGFFLVSKGNWQPLLACLCGFILGRFIISKLIADKILNNPPLTQTADRLTVLAKSASGAKHAP